MRGSLLKGIPPPRREDGPVLQVTELIVGHACPPERFLWPGGGWKALFLPARCFLLRHPQRGAFLWDTGYGPGYWRATGTGLARLLRWLIPARLEQGHHLLDQLAALGLSPDELAGVGLSHFHPDHVGSVPDLPVLPYYVLASAWLRVTGQSNWKALLSAQFKSLLPTTQPHFFEDLPSRVWPGWESLGPGWDWFGDGSARIFSLPGHTRGHLGLWMQRESRPLFAVGDAYYLPEQLEGLQLPVPTRWVVEDAPAYRQTLERLAQLRRRHPEVDFIACHQPYQEG